MDTGNFPSQIPNQISDYSFSKLKRTTLVVCSKDRDVSNYPNPNSYKIRLDDFAFMKKIKSLRLLTAVFPDVSDITKEPALILQIKQLDGFSGATGTNTHLNSGSILLQMNQAVATGSFVNIKRDSCSQSCFKTPESLYSLDIAIKNIDGGLFSFGADSNPANKALQHILVFEVLYEDQ